MMVVWLVSIYRYCCEEPNICIAIYGKGSSFFQAAWEDLCCFPAVHIFGSDLCVFCLHRYVDVCQNY